MIKVYLLQYKSISLYSIKYKMIKYENNASYHHYTTYTIKQGTLAPGCTILITLG